MVTKILFPAFVKRRLWPKRLLRIKARLDQWGMMGVCRIFFMALRCVK